MIKELFSTNTKVKASPVETDGSIVQTKAIRFKQDSWSFPFVTYVDIREVNW